MWFVGAWYVGFVLELWVLDGGLYGAMVWWGLLAMEFVKGVGGC